MMPAALPAQARLAYALAADGRVDGARSVVRGMIRLDAQSPLSTGYFAMIESWLGDPEIGVGAARRCVDQLPKSPHAHAILAFALAVAGDKESARGILDLPAYGTATVGLSAMASPAWITLNCPERALAALEHAFNSRCPWLTTLMHDPRNAELGTRPEFRSILEEVFAPPKGAGHALGTD